jgi:hypothetical protein
MHRSSLPPASVACALWILLSSAAGAGPLTWDQFGFVDPTSASNTTAHGSGTVTVTTSPLIEVGGCGCGLFLTDSARYPNIDEVLFNLLVVTPTAAQTGSPYTITFDFAGTTLDSGGAINVGGMFWAPATGAATTFSVQAFGPDDTTPFPLANLHFEQHVLFPGDDAPLTWDPVTGLLAVTAFPTVANSQFGFLSPSSGEIGRIVFTATTQAIATNGDQVYFGVGHAVPEPKLALMLLAGALFFGARRRSRERAP